MDEKTEDVQLITELEYAEMSGKEKAHCLTGDVPPENNRLHGRLGNNNRDKGIYVFITGMPHQDQSDCQQCVSQRLACVWR